MNRRMYEWQRQIQTIVDEIDRCIKTTMMKRGLTLCFLSRAGYSEFYTTRKFKKYQGIPFRDYLRLRKLAFALKEVRDSEKSILILRLIMDFRHMKLLREPLRDIRRDSE